VVLSTYELNPYIGQNLSNNGATSDIIESAFKAVDYQLNIRYYPASRAKKLAQQGEVIGTFPVIYDPALESDFIFSDPIPGMHLGLLRKKSNNAMYNSSADNNKIGIIRGAFSDAILKLFSDHSFLEVATNEQLLQMLMKGRVNFVLIDKYTAADIMADKLPQIIGQLEFIESTVKAVDFRVAFSARVKGIQTVVNAFNQGLKKNRENGEVNNILYQHGLYYPYPQSNKKILSIATVDNADMVIMQRLTSEFEKENPDIKLHWKVMDENILRRRLLSDLAISGGQYDIMTIGSAEVSILAKRGWLLPISDIPDDYDVNDIIKPVYDSLLYENRLYALPFYGESSMMYYRKDLFKKAGITVSNNPSYEEILSYAEKIHDPEKQIYGICLRGKAGWGENMIFIDTMVNAFGGQWFDMNWETTIKSAKWKKAVSFYINLLSQYGPPNAHKNGYSENLALFSNGHCGIWIDSTAAASTLYSQEKSKVHKKLGFTASPVAVTSKGSRWLSTWALAVTKSSKLPIEAQKFIIWATSKSYINLVANNDGWIAVPPGTRKSTYNNQYQAVAPFSSFVLEAIKGTDPFDNTLNPSPYKGIQGVAIPEFPTLGTQVGLYINQALQGKLSVDEALSKSQLFVDKQMKAAGYGR